MSTSLYWLARQFEDVPEHDAWLSTAERDILAGFRFPKRRNDWRLGRWTAKQTIRAYQSGKDLDLASLEIRAAADGAPEAFRDGSPGNVSISISHSNGVGLCVVGPPGLSVGCDVEQIEPREVQFFKDYFTSEEIALLDNGPEDRSLIAYLIWCAKESALKSLREGLRLDTRTIIVRPDFGEASDSWKTWTAECTDSPRRFSGWWQLRNGFIYAMTADRITSSPIQLATE
jgi:4'-phosphopantetheinyl transferase